MCLLWGLCLANDDLQCVVHDLRMIYFITFIRTPTIAIFHALFRTVTLREVVLLRPIW